MRSRVLPREEWDRLEGNDLQAILSLTQPENISAVVVEDGERIVAKMLVARLTHLEGVWIDPEYRNGGVIGSLLRETFRVAGEWTTEAVIAGAADSHMTNILARMGAVHLPLQFYVLGKEASCRQQ